MMEEFGDPSNTVISHSPLKREYGRFQPPWPWASLLGRLFLYPWIWKRTKTRVRLSPSNRELVIGSRIFEGDF